MRIMGIILIEKIKLQGAAKLAISKFLSKFKAERQDQREKDC